MKRFGNAIPFINTSREWYYLLHKMKLWTNIVKAGNNVRQMSPFYRKLLLGHEITEPHCIR